MSKKNNIILIFIVSLMVFAGCNAIKIPRDYLPNPYMLKKSITGSWIEVNVDSHSSYVQNIQLAGELIAVHSDSLFILSDIQLSAVHRANIDTAVLYVFKNQGGRYALVTGLLLAPDIIGAIAYSLPEFLILGIPVLLVGSAATLIEGTSKSNRLLYPGRNSFEEFGKFARFPAGIPPAVKRNELHLLKK